MTPLPPPAARPVRHLRPMYGMLGALIAGVFLAGVLPLPPPIVLFAASAVLLAINFIPTTARAVVSATLLSLPFLALGAGLALQAATPLSNDVYTIAGGKASLWIEGTIASELAQHPTGSVSFTLDARAVDDFVAVRPASGGVQVTIAHPSDSAPTLLPGDTVWLRGRVEAPEGITNPNGFDERAYLARRGIHSTIVVRRPTDLQPVKDAPSAGPISRLIETIRDRTLASISTHLGADDAAILSGILLSEKSRLPADVQDDFSRTGALHILSVSGLHLAALAWALTTTLGAAGVPRRGANALVVALLWLFAFASGCGVAAVRAAIVLTIVLLAPLLRRTAADPVHSLSVAALILLICRPLSLYDAGFQLSFATLAVLLLWLPPMEKLLLPWEPGQPFRATVARYILIALLAGIVAQIGAWPLVAYYFNVISIVAPVASVLVAPLAVILLLGGLAAAAVSAVLPAWAVVPLWATLALCLHLLHALTFSLAALPFAAFSIVSPSPIFLVIYYAVIGGAAPFVRRKVLRKILFAPGHGGPAGLSGPLLFP